MDACTARNCRRSAETSAGVNEDVSRRSKPRGCGGAGAEGRVVVVSGDGIRALLDSWASSDAERGSPMEQLM
jgi:hypothetical protein